MIRIGIVEDDDASAALLHDHLRRYEQDHGEKFAVSRFVDGAAAVEGFRPDFDILLLDIEMPRLDGFSAAEQIRAADPDVIIIFITNMTQYALKGYEVDALSYVVKPVPYFAFAQEIKRSIARLRRRTVDYLMLQIDGGIIKVPTTDIIFLESAKHRTLVHTIDGIHSVVAPLKALEAQLDPTRFFRSNSGYVVNLRHVLGVRGNSSLHVGGHDLLVSRARKKDFLAALTDYLGERHP